MRDTGGLLKTRGYDIKVLDLINMDKSYCYNPFVYLHSDNDIQKLVIGTKCNASVDGYTDFIFLNRDGNLHNQSSLNNAVHRIRRDCNDEILLNRKTDKEPVLLPYFTCHHLRHTFATRLCESGINIKVIQNVLGHVDISTTMNIYIDVTNDLKKEEMLTYAKFVGNSKGEIETAV